jgi:dienelactone hydrolase
VKKFAYLTVLFFLILTIQVQETIACTVYTDPQPGTIIDTVRCRVNPKFSYALYLPKNYSKTSKWPVICIFDPAARGKLAITNFSQAADKFGYILICSNQSRNGMSWNDYAEIANHLLTDAENRYSIDYNRIYTSGFSGGSRAAAFIALKNKIIAGVIACGAGFPEIAERSLPNFDYFGLVGNRDMNYLEMCGLEKKLISQGVTTDLRVFNGDHNWPSPDLLQEAVEWFELQSMKKGTKPKDHAFMASLFVKYKNRADIFLKQGNLTESARTYAFAIKDFPDQMAIPKLKEKLDSLQNTKDYQNSVLEGDKIRTQELEIQNTLMTAFQGHVLMKSLPDSLRNWWGFQIKMLRKMENSRDTLKQMMASRQLNLLSVVCYETGRNFTGLKKFKSGVNCYLIESMILPENKNIHYLLARVYSLDNDPKNSLKSLDKAIKLGYNNRQSIEKDTAFVSLKNEKRFREVMLQLK